MAKQRKSRPISEAELRSMIQEGLTHGAIAERFGYSNVSSITTTVHVLGIYSTRAGRPPTQSDARIAEFAQRIIRGESLASIARAEGLHCNSLRHMLKRCGHPASAREYLARQRAEA